MRAIVLIAFGLSGAAALIYEVAWTRALALVLGSTTYALSTMLGTFMAGLAIGGFLGGRLADRGRNLLVLFGMMELGIGIFGIITIPLINSLPPVYFRVYKAFRLDPGIYFTFQFLLCSGIMLIPTTLMGATFPVVSRWLTHSMDEMGKWVGEAYSFNTIGAVLGSLGAGFLLIPLLGVRAATLTAASFNVGVAVLMLACSRTRLKGGAIAGLVIAVAVPLAVAFASEESERGLTVYNAGRYKTYEDFRKGSYGQLLFEKEALEGRVKIWRDRETKFLLLQVGAKNEGTTPNDMPNTLLLSYLPIASHPEPESMLLIGLGTGITLWAAKPYIEDLSVVEINSGVIEGIGKHGPPGVLGGVDVAANDGRNHLLLSDKTYDIITSGTSYPANQGSASLFTREFYEMASTRLNPGGLYCQWLPNYHLTGEDIAMMLKTFGSVFEHIYLWHVPPSDDAIMIGSHEPFGFEEPEIRRRLLRLTKGKGLPFELLMNPEQAREKIAESPDVPYNTDDMPVLEFRMARRYLSFESPR